MRTFRRHTAVVIIAPMCLLIAIGCDPNMNPNGQDGGPDTSVAIDTGGSLEFAGGSLPTDATVTTTPADAALLPLGVTPIGTPIRIDIDQAVTRPFEIRLPIPSGVDGAQASIFEITDGGATTLLSTSVEGNELVASSIHFSRISAATKGIALQDAQIDGVKAAIGLRDSVTDVPNVSPPRQGAIVGPAFLAPGEGGLFVLTGFDDAPSASLETNWLIFGDADLAVGGTGTTSLSDARVVELTPTEEGRVDLTVDYTDPFSGQRGFASARVTVTADTSDDLTLRLLDGSLEQSVDERLNGFFVTVTNSDNGPITYGWNYGDGSGRQTETDDSAIPVGIMTSPHTYTRADTFDLVVDATDATGRTGSLTIPITVTESMLSLLIDGPLSGPVAPGPFATTEYTYRFSGGTPDYTLQWEFLPTSQRGGTETVAVEFADAVLLSEPGSYLLTARLTDSVGASTTYTKPVTVTGGSALNLTVSAERLTVAPDEAVGFTFSIVGGVLVTNGQRRPYDLVFNWNDGSVSTLDVDSDSTRTAVSDSLIHSFDEVGMYVVTARVVDATGEFREREITIEVTEDGEPTDGEMPGTMCDENSEPPDEDCFAVINITGQGSVSSSSVFGNDTTNFGVGLSVDGNASSSWFSDGDPDGENDSEVYTWTFGGDNDIFLARVETDPEQFNGGGQFGFATVTVRVLDAGGGEVFNTGAIGLSEFRVDISEVFPAGLAGRTVQLVLVGHQDPSCGGFSELRVFGFERIQLEEDE